MDRSTTQGGDAAWRSLYRVGGLAPLITLSFYLSQVAFISWETFPSTTLDWFLLLQRNKLLGLFYLNALDMVSIALMAPMFLALYVALRRDNESFMAIAALFAYLGIAVFIAPRSAMLSVLPLSDQYVAATTEVQRTQTLAAGEAVLSLGQATLQTVGFLLISVAVLIISGVMLRSKTLGIVTAWVGILASALTFADNVCVLLVPSLADPLLVVAGVFWVVWWILIAVKLLQLGGLGRKPRPQPS